MAGSGSGSDDMMGMVDLGSPTRVAVSDGGLDISRESGVGVVSGEDGSGAPITELMGKVRELTELVGNQARIIQGLEEKSKAADSGGSKKEDSERKGKGI